MKTDLNEDISIHLNIKFDQDTNLCKAYNNHPDPTSIAKITYDIGISRRTMKYFKTEVSKFDCTYSEKDGESVFVIPKKFYYQYMDDRMRVYNKTYPAPSYVNNFISALDVYTDFGSYFCEGNGTSLMENVRIKNKLINLDYRIKFSKEARNDEIL